MINPNYLRTRQKDSVDFHVLRTLKHKLDTQDCQEQWLPWVFNNKTFTIKKCQTI